MASCHQLLTSHTKIVSSSSSIVFNSLSISACCSAVECIVSSSMTLGIFRSTGNDTINLRVSLEMFGFSSSILLFISTAAIRHITKLNLRIACEHSPL